MQNAKCKMQKGGGGDHRKGAASCLRVFFAFGILHFALITALLLAAGCSQRAASSESGYLVVAQRTSPNSLDPRLASDEATARIGQLVFSALLSIGDDLRPRPQLARE